MLDNIITVHELMNTLAIALQICHSFTTDFSSFDAHPDAASICKSVVDSLNSAYRNGLPTLIGKIKNLMSSMPSPDIAALAAYASISWINAHITYDSTEDASHISLYELLPKGTPVTATEIYLNTNGETSGFLLFPLFDAVDHYARDNPERKHRLHNRDYLWGIHLDFRNFGYKRFNDSRKILHSILWFEKPDSSHPNHYRVGFTPISKNIIFQTNDYVDNSEKIPQRIKTVTRIENAPLCNDRLLNAIKISISKNLGIDLLFAPELLGTDDMYSEDDAGIALFVEKTATDNEDSVFMLPRIIILPSRSKNHENYSIVSSGEGIILGKQYKQFAFIDHKMKYKEDLFQKKEIEILIIHIPGQQRIVTLLCRDFLSTPDSELSEFVFRQINPTLLIVPSYTTGEEEFVRKIHETQPYGTSVVWGNCCTAHNTPGIIGACSVAGIDSSVRMIDSCICNFECNNKSTCLFYVDIPLDVQLSEASRPQIRFTHICS